MIDWLDLLAVQGTLKSLLQHHSSKASIFWHSAFFTVQLSHPYMTTGKTIALTRWTEVRDIVQETGIRTIPMEKKCKKAKWLSEEALQIAVKRREAKSKGQKERYSHLNAEFQRIARRDKKTFFTDVQNRLLDSERRQGWDILRE